MTAIFYDSQHPLALFSVARTMQVRQISLYDLETLNSALSSSPDFVSATSEKSPSSSPSTLVEPTDDQVLLLARMVSCDIRFSADEVYVSCPPIVLASLSLKTIDAQGSSSSSPFVVPLPQLWRIERGSTVLMTLSSVSQLPCACEMLSKSAVYCPFCALGGLPYSDSTPKPATTASCGAKHYEEEAATLWGKSFTDFSSDSLISSARRFSIQLHGCCFGDDYPVDEKRKLRLLISRRWYECDRDAPSDSSDDDASRYKPTSSSTTKRASFSERPSSPSRKAKGRRIEGRPQNSLVPGEVREALAISHDLRSVKWADGSVWRDAPASMRVQPYSHFFVVKDAAEAVAVRTEPGEGGKVVGYLTPEVVFEALGQVEVKGGVYCLVYDDSSDNEEPSLISSRKRSRESDTVLEHPARILERDGRYIKGWIKVGKAGETTDSDTILCAGIQELKGFDVAHGCQIRFRLLSSSSSASSRSAEGLGREEGSVAPSVAVPSTLPLATGQLLFSSSYPTLFSVRNPVLGVRVRDLPALGDRSAVLRVLAPNEVKEAVELIEISFSPKSPSSDFPSYANPKHSSSPLIFVRWHDGGYSLAQKGTEIFLTQVFPPLQEVE